MIRSEWRPLSLWVERSKEHRGQKKPPVKRPTRSSTAPAKAPARGRGRPAGLFTWLAVGLVVVVVAALVIVKVASGSSEPARATSSFQAAEPHNGSAELTNVPASVFNTVGVTSPIAPVDARRRPNEAVSPRLTATNASGQKVPEILYMGAEYCPYCAAQRWSTSSRSVASAPGQGLGNMSSYASDVYPNTPTFTFLKANYTSKYLVFKSVEVYANYLERKTKTTTRPCKSRPQQEEHEITKYDTAKYITGLHRREATDRSPS